MFNSKLIYKTVYAIIFILAAVLLIYYILVPTIDILPPFIISLVLAYLLKPIIDYLDSKKVSRILSILLVYLGLLLIVILIFNYLYPMIYYNANDLIKALPDITEKYRFLSSEIAIRYELSGLPDTFKAALEENISNIENAITNAIYQALKIISLVISNAFYIALIPIITFYFLKDSENLKEKSAYIIPKKYRLDAAVVSNKIDFVLKRFIRGQLLVALIVGILTGLGMYLIGVKYSLVLGIIAGITDIIPYLGPFLGAVPCLIIAFAQSPVLSLKALLVILLIQQFESGIISPKIVGKSVGLHPITIIFILLLWERVFGVVGMFFAVPVTTILLIIFENIINKYIKYND